MTGLTPSTEQQSVLDLGLTSIRVRAGAGTGKTTTVAMVIFNLIENHGIESEQILGITFTNKAAAELADRARSGPGSVLDPGRQVEVHTYHGFAAQVLAEFGAIAGVDSRVRIITPTFSRQLLSETFHHRTYQHLDITQPRTLDRVRRLGDRLGDHLLQPADLISSAPPTPDEVWEQRIEMARALEDYWLDKRRLGVVDYSDLVTLSTRIVEEYPELGAVIRDRYRVLVLDEYQDTNPAQRSLLEAIFGSGFPVIAVGDEDQTIYEWRGASAENFELFPRQFPTRDGLPAVQRELTLNRRSTGQILEIANSVRTRANPTADALEPADRNVTGEVMTHWASDALAEADWIARRFESFHDAGCDWREMAVLFRKNKDFPVVVDALTRHDIPVEVANVGGLFSVPEVAEVRAWLTALDRPGDAGALTQILFGSRFRLGLADLAPLTRWLSVSDVDDSEEPTPITLIEAIESAGDIPDLRAGARLALEGFMEIYRDLLVESQGQSLVEVCRTILDRTRAWQDVEALPASARLTARLNLYRLLDLAEDWSPLQGRPSVSAFLDYLAAMEDEPAEELDSARLSGEDAVTLVTVHRAKGLEWETVAIPAVTKGNFPSGSQQYPDPARFAESLPEQMRIDSVLSDMPSEPKERHRYLQDQHYRQEWRVAYVAITRARRRLLVSGAHWYGLPEPAKNPKQPSELFDLVAEHPDTRDTGSAPMVDRPALLRPPTAFAAPDPLFADGWPEALRRTNEDPDWVTRLAAEMSLDGQHETRVQEMNDRLFDLAEPTALPAAEETETAISVTGLVTYAQCPKRFFWSDVDPLPRRSNPAAQRGTEVHRRIELHQRGQVGFEEVAEDLYDVPDGGAVGEHPYDAYLGSRYADMRASLVETPFTVELSNGFRVRGRIDAVYTDGVDWEVVDFKSGRRSDDESRVVQLQAYAVAARDVDFGITGPDRLDVSFVYLGGGLDVVSFHADEDWMTGARESVERLTNAMAAADYEETPGPWCKSCDFLRFCAPGQAAVSA